MYLAFVTGSDECDLYDQESEMKIYGGGFSCGEVILPEPQPYVVSGGKKSVDTHGISGLAYIAGGVSSFDSGDDPECNECAITVDDPVCSGKDALVVLKNFVEQKDVPLDSMEPVKIVGAAKKLTGCETEECALLSVARENPSARAILAETIRDNFKVDGPGDSTKWLNNNNIDNVLAQICRKFPTLVRLPFHMIDMIDPESEHSAPGKLTLKNIDIDRDILQAGKNMMCVVINTDTTGGPGIHWFCLFCDFRRAGTSEDPYTIEYFNSSGARARREVAEWMHRAIASVESSTFPDGSPRFAKRVTAATIQHQKDTDSECGVYSLYYIWRRINGAPIEEFATRIPDAQMIKFRQKLFRNRETSPAN